MPFIRFQTGHEDWNKGQTSLRDGLYEESLSCNFSWTHPYLCRSPWALHKTTVLQPSPLTMLMVNVGSIAHVYVSFFLGFGSIPRKGNLCHDSILHHCLMFFCALNRGSWNISARWSSVQKDEELPPHPCLSVPSTGGLWLAYRFCVVYLSPIVSHHFLNFQQPWHPRQCVVYEKWGQTRGLRWLQRHLLHQAERLPEGLRALGLQSEDEKAKGWDIWDLIFPQFVPE